MQMDIGIDVFSKGRKEAKVGLIEGQKAQRDQYHHDEPKISIGFFHGCILRCLGIYSEKDGLSPYQFITNSAPYEYLMYLAFLNRKLKTHWPILSSIS